MRHSKKIPAFCCLLFILARGISARGQTQTEPAGSRPDLALSIATTQPWTDTGLDLHPGDIVQITAAPAAKVQAVPDRHAVAPAASTCDPQGSAAAPSVTNLPLASAPEGALIAKLHNQGALPLLIGVHQEFKIDEAGHLYLGVNTSGQPSCQGNFAVKVHLAGGSAAATATASSVKSKLAAAAQTWISGQFGSPAAPVTPENSAVANSAGAPAGTATATPATASSLSVSDVPLATTLRDAVDHLPRRVNDKLNNLGDMVNFIVIGAQKDVQAALEAANWHVADTSSASAVTKAILMAREKKDYLEMPMSQLYLFGRVQDFGYEQAEPYAVVASRHHFRLWKAPFLYDGKEVWVGAGTHDVGFEKDQRNGSVTHKIDPAVDGERDHIGASLQQAGKVKVLSYYLPPSPIQEAHNATGGGYHSDGRILVIELP
jgi:hypothetical protein